MIFMPAPCINEGLGQKYFFEPLAVVSWTKPNLVHLQSICFCDNGVSDQFGQEVTVEFS